MKSAFSWEHGKHVFYGSAEFASQKCALLHIKMCSYEAE